MKWKSEQGRTKKKTKKQKITSLLLIELQQKVERNKAAGSTSSYG